MRPPYPAIEKTNALFARSIRLLWLWVTGSQLLDAELSQPLPHINCLLQALALDNASHETAGKRITSSICVVDLLRANCMHRHLLDLGVAARLGGHGNGGVGALGEDDGAGALGVYLGQGGDFLGDFYNRGCVVAVGFREGGCFGFVTDENVDVGEDGVEGVFEELCNEGGGEVEDEGLGDVLVFLVGFTFLVLRAVFYLVL